MKTEGTRWRDHSGLSGRYWQIIGDQHVRRGWFLPLQAKTGRHEVLDFGIEGLLTPGKKVRR
jgi:hypothetical protein